MGDWQPIETAPRDGTRILAIWLYDPTRPECSSQPHAVIYWNGVGWEENMCGQVEPEPSHWRPLPEPPLKARKAP